MLDAHLRPYINPPLDKLGHHLVQLGITPCQVTTVGFVFGISSCIGILLKAYAIGLVFLLLNRFCDGLDGAVARHSKMTDFGGFLDIVCDFIIYSAVVVSFGLTSLENLLPALLLIFCFIGPMSSFLAYAVIAAKKGLQTKVRGEKSFYHTGGICEGTETILTLSGMCLFPEFFPHLCLGFGLLCLITTIGRIYAAWYDFGFSMQEELD